MGGGAPHTARRGTAVTDQYGGPTTREAGWLPDPGGRHQYRYHDGLGWTDHVSTNGQQRRDPLPVAPPPPPAGPAWGASANSSSGPVPARDGSWPAASGSHWPDQPTPPGGVTMGEAVRRVLGNYAQFKGRAPRSEYWWFVLAMWLLLISVVFVGAIAGLSDEALDGLSMLAVLALLLPHLAVMVRRLHDTDRTGWWALAMFIPLVGVVTLIVLLALPGDDRPNQYGPPLTR
jgi:uncharacterized membrane protein YhaH (DUF805 family)